MLFLRSSPQNQAEAERENYFKLISNLICEVPQDIFDESTIKVILHIKHTITDTQLLDQYFSDLLWPLLQSQIALARKEELL